MRPDKEDTVKYEDFIKRIVKMLKEDEDFSSRNSGIFNIGMKYKSLSTETQLDYSSEDSVEDFAKLIAEDFQEAFDAYDIDFDEAKIAYIEFESELNIPVDYDE